MAGDFESNRLLTPMSSATLVPDRDETMLPGIRSRANQFGITSVLLSLAFWVYVYLPRDASNPHRFDARVEMPLAALSLALITALVAAKRGSKWWLLALAGPVFGGMLVLSLRT